jgi:hypothetical protein
VTRLRFGSRLVSTAASALLTGVLLASCGSSSPADAVRQAAGSVGPSRCDVYTDSFFERVAGLSAAAGRASCRQLARSVPAVQVRIVQVQTNGNTAQVTAQAAGRTVTYRLVRVGGRWMIDGVV